jgi:hypothetical protein
MEHFISIVFEQVPDEQFENTFLACFENLAESIMEDETQYEEFDTNSGERVYRIGIKESPTDAEAEKLAEHLYTHLYVQGYDNFDIEVSGDEDINEGKKHGNSKVYDKCWKGYKKVPGKKRGEKGSCVKEDELEELEETYDGDDFHNTYGEVLPYFEDYELEEAEYQGRKVKLGKPMRGDVKKFKVYVKNAKGNVVKVNFGDPNMRIKKSNPKRRKSFRARHNCDNPGPRWKARYWSCRKW